MLEYVMSHSESTVLGSLSLVGTRYRSTDLPSSIVEGSSVMDLVWNRCTKCEGKEVPYALLQQHTNWHARVNILYFLRIAIIKELEETPSFGPQMPVVLLPVTYDEPMLEMDVRQEDAVALLVDLSKKDALVSLTYVDGHTITFGNKGISRLSQGEFIYLNLRGNDDDDDEEDHPEENYFKLIFKSDCIWITVYHVEGFRSSTTTLVTVNGEELICDEGESRKLEFGDIITVAVGERGCDNEKLFADFVVQASIPPTCKLGQTQSNTEPGPSSSVVKIDENESYTLLNPLILERVVYCLPHNALKRSRLVSQLWNEESIKVLRDRMVLTVFEPARPQHYWSRSQPLEMGFPAWRISLNFSDRPEEGPLVVEPDWESGSIPVLRGARRGIEEERARTTTMESQSLADLMWLLHPDRMDNTCVTSLTLTGPLDSEPSVKGFEEALCAMQSTLRTLDLKLTYLRPIDDINVPNFPALTSLSVSFHRGSNQSDARSWFAKLLPAVNNVQEVRMSIAGYHGHSRLEEVEAYVLQEMSMDTFAKLTQIVIDRCGESLMRILPSFRSGSLTKLQLGGLSYNDQLRRHLRSTLENQAGSLKELLLHFQLRSNAAVVINFPGEMMPKLKSLAFLFKVSPILSEHTVAIKFGDGDEDNDGRIDYNRYFPALTELTVEPIRSDNMFGRLDEDDVRSRTSWITFLPILTPFLHTAWMDAEDAVDAEERPIPVPDMRALRIPLLLRGKYASILDNLEVVFPNVNDFPLGLAKAREAPLWDLENEDDEDGGELPEVEEVEDA